LKEIFKVTELEKKQTDKLDETVTSYKAILFDEHRNRIVLTSEKPIDLMKQDEVEFKRISAQQKISGSSKKSGVKKE